MKKVNALVLTGFGLNCDNETAFVFERAGAVAHRVHINALVSGKVKLEDFHILAFGGGFSWGDDHGAGVIQALKLKNQIEISIVFNMVFREFRRRIPDTTQYTCRCRARRKL